MKKAKQLTDEEIVAKLTKGEDMNTCISQLYLNNYASILNFVLKNEGVKEDAEDVLQDGVISLITILQKGGFERNSTLDTFFFGICKFKWLNILKNKKVRRDRKVYVQELTEDIEQLIITEEKKNLLISLMDALGEICKKILYTHFYGNQSLQDIFNELPFESLQGVYNKKAKCMKTLVSMVQNNENLKKQLKTMLGDEI